MAHQSKTNQDEINELLTDPPQVRRLVRRANSSFRLIREVLRYGRDCELVSPESMRNRLKQELQAMCQQYNL